MYGWEENKNKQHCIELYCAFILVSEALVTIIYVFTFLKHIYQCASARKHELIAQVQYLLFSSVCVGLCMCA